MAAGYVHATINCINSILNDVVKIRDGVCDYDGEDEPIPIILL